MEADESAIADDGMATEGSSAALQARLGEFLPDMMAPSSDDDGAADTKEMPEMPEEEKESGEMDAEEAAAAATTTDEETVAPLQPPTTPPPATADVRIFGLFDAASCSSSLTQEQQFTCSWACPRCFSSIEALRGGCEVCAPCAPCFGEQANEQTAG